MFKFTSVCLLDAYLICIHEHDVEPDFFFFFCLVILRLFLVV